MRHNIILLTLLTGLLFLSACQKEYSLELSGTRSSGSLQSDALGACLPKTVEGIYEAGTVLDGTENYIDVQVNVASVGTYRIYSDTVNGIYFEAKGAFATTGLNNVRLAGNGTPLTAGTQSFVITYDSTECAVAVTTLPQGGAGPAEFTLTGAPNTCQDFNVSGNYIRGTALTAANTVTIKVNVTKIGTYDITIGESNGMTFSGSGALAALGEQTITLTGSGTPAVVNNTTISVPHGATTCGFTVNVTEGAQFTINCASAVVEGTYEEGVALGSANTVELTVDVTTAGPYTITATAGGMTFTGTGTFAATGAGQIITLTGSGTPTADGVISVQIPGACAFDVTMDPGATPTDLKWKFTSGGTTYEGPTEAVIIIPNPTGTGESMAIFGTTTAGDIDFNLSLTSNADMNTGTFSTAVAPFAGNWATFTVSNATSAAIIYTGLFGSGTTLTVNLTTYNETTRIVEGTFSGTAKNASNANVNITNGTFKAEIP